MGDSVPIVNKGWTFGAEILPTFPNNWALYCATLKKYCAIWILRIIHNCALWLFKKFETMQKSPFPNFKNSLKNLTANFAYTSVNALMQNIFSIKNRNLLMVLLRPARVTRINWGWAYNWISLEPKTKINLFIIFIMRLQDYNTEILLRAQLVTNRVYCIINRWASMKTVERKKTKKMRENTGDIDRTRGK